MNIVSLEIFPNLKKKKFLFFFKKINRNILNISIPFNFKINYNKVLKTSFFLYKIGIIPTVHFYNNFSLFNCLRILKLLNNNSVKKILILKGEINKLKNKTNTISFLKHINKYIAFYLNIHKKSKSYKKNIIFFKNKISSFKFIFQQSFCFLSFIFFLNLFKFKKKKIKLGFFLFKNFNKFKKITFNCNIFINKWNYFCFSKNFKKNYNFYIFLLILNITKIGYKKIHFYTLNEFNKTYNYLNKIYEKKNSSFRL
ncbi:hypothetical protein [Candidatus Vidania fulgoroideorum]